MKVPFYLCVLVTCVVTNFNEGDLLGRLFTIPARSPGQTSCLHNHSPSLKSTVTWAGGLTFLCLNVVGKAGIWYIPRN